MKFAEVMILPCSALTVAVLSVCAFSDSIRHGQRVPEDNRRWKHYKDRRLPCEVLFRTMCAKLSSVEREVNA